MVGGEAADKVEVELFAVEVGSGYSDTDRVAEGEGVVCLAAYEAEVAVVEVKGFVAEVSHGDKAFALVGLYLCVYAKLGDSADLGVKLLAYLV